MDNPLASPLELDNVSIQVHTTDGTLEIAQDLNIRLASGEMFCVAGRSGSGKTTILRVAAGLTAPTSGTVLWAGVRIASQSSSKTAQLRRTHLGYLDQNGPLLDGLSALENVLLPAVPDRSTRRYQDRALELMHRLGIGNRTGARPRSLSGGERQRVGLARALLMEPALLIVDEPTASLDRVNADNVISCLIDAASAGTAVLVSSHDPSLIRQSGSALELEGR